MTLSSRFRVSAGSIIGREHARVHRNNQDALALSAQDDLVTAVVADGCGSGRYSEVGARLGSRWLSEWLPRYAAIHGLTDALVDAAADGLTGFLAGLAHTLTPDPDAVTSSIADHLLFTFLACVMSRETTLVFGVGDGLYRVNGHTSVLDAKNTPPYVAYRLVPSVSAPVASLHHRGPTEEIRCLILATDGAAELASLDEFATEDCYTKNPFLLQRRLVVYGERERRLTDDTSMVLIRRVS